LEKIYFEKGTELLAFPPNIIDQFSKDDRISFTHRLVFQASDRTLTDEEVSKIMDGVNSEISKNSSWQIR
jgi:phenylalanyl-tRNA synthetase beta subunit